MIVARTVGRHRVAHDAPKQSARWVARDDVGVHPVAELMLIQTLGSILRLSVLVFAFATYGIADACPRHKVAFVAAIHEYLGPDGSPLVPFRKGEGDALHLVSFLLGTDDAPFVPDVCAVLYVCLGKETLECGEGDLGFEVERGRGHAVMLPDASVELACEAFDDAAVARAVAYVCPSQAACRKAAKPLRRRHEQHALALQLCCICRHDASRRTAIDADIHILAHLFIGVFTHHLHAWAEFDKIQYCFKCRIIHSQYNIFHFFFCC